MNRLVLYVPVLALGMPLSTYLALVDASAEKPPEVKAVQTSGDPLPGNDPVVFLQMCLERYDREVKGYTCTMVKQERINGRLNPNEEVIDVSFKEHPHSVVMGWKSGTGLVDRALYVEGENHGKLVARGGFFGIKKVVERDVDGKEAKSSGRYTLNEFGIKKATERNLNACLAARKAGTLYLEYLGVFAVDELGGRPCYKLHRVCDPPERDGLTDLTIYVDKETWLQVGSILKGGDGKLIARYFFRDIHLNPDFNPERFTRATLKN